LKKDGTSCDKVLVQVESDKVIVELIDSMTVTGCLHLEFIFRGGWTGKGKRVVASFRLELENQGVGASFRLEPKNYIYKKTSGFLPFGFPRKYWCIVFLM
jgi:hypothetical protein